MCVCMCVCECVSVCECACMCVHVCVCVYACACVCAVFLLERWHEYAQEFTFVYTQNTYKLSKQKKHANTRTHARTHARTHTHTYTHTYTHTRTHTHTHTLEAHWAGNFLCAMHPHSGDLCTVLMRRDAVGAVGVCGVCFCSGVC